MATIILGCIFSMLFSDFKTCGLISIIKPSIVALTEFFHAVTETNVYPLPIPWYLISLLWMYLCSSMHIMFILWSIAETLSSGNCPILFKILTLNVAICIVRLHFSNFCFNLSSVADYLNTGVRAPTSVGCVPFLPARRAMRFGQMVWMWVMVIFRLQFFSHL